MADHSKPTITSTYSNFVTELDTRLDDLAVGLDPVATTATNVPTNSIRWSSASNKWQKFNGSSWADLSSLFAINISGNAGTVTNGVYTSGSYADPAWLTSIAGSKVSGSIAGNAGSATQLANARNINGVAFNGTAAIDVNLNNAATFNSSGNGATSGNTFNGSSALVVSYNTLGAPSISGTNATGTWGISITGNASTVSGGVYTSGNQSISGVKTFNSTIVGSISGSAASVANGVYTTGDQTISGIKTFNSTIQGSISGNAATSTKLSTTTGSAPGYVARAWVNFNGVNATGTYNRSGTLVTVNMAAHGMQTGHVPQLIFSTGTGGTPTSGSYTITVVDVNNFTLNTLDSGTITGSAQVTRNSYVRGSGNVTAIGDLGTGDYQVYFTTAMPDANYSAQASISGMTLIPLVRDYLTTSVRVTAAAGNNVQVDQATVSVVIHR